MWLNQLSALAPCQCLTLAGMVITVPGVRLTAGLPSSWYQPSPAVLGYYVTAIFFQNPLSKKTARTTAYHTVYGQLIYNYLLFSQVWVDKRNPTWYPSRVRVSTG